MSNGLGRVIASETKLSAAVGFREPAALESAVNHCFVLFFELNGKFISELES